MSPSTPITVVASFSLPASQQQHWFETWSNLAAFAEHLPACHEFRVHHDACEVASRWDDAAAFHEFVRNSGALWLSHMYGHWLLPNQLTYVDNVPEGVVAGAR